MALVQSALPGAPVSHRAAVTAVDAADPTSDTNTSNMTGMPNGNVIASGVSGGLSGSIYGQVDFDCVFTLSASGSGSCTVAVMKWDVTLAAWVQAATQTLTITSATRTTGLVRYASGGETIYLKVTAISGTGASLTATAQQN